VAYKRADRDGYPSVFNLNRDEDMLKLNANNARPENRWNADNQFVFLLRKSFFSALQNAVFLFGAIQTAFPCNKSSAGFLKFYGDHFNLRV